MTSLGCASDGFDGILREVRYWKRKRSQQEMRRDSCFDLAGNLRKRIPPGLFGLWQMSSPSMEAARARGPVVTDQVGSFKQCFAHQTRWVFSDVDPSFTGKQAPDTFVSAETKIELRGDTADDKLHSYHGNLVQHSVKGIDFRHALSNPRTHPVVFRLRNAESSEEFASVQRYIGEGLPATSSNTQHLVGEIQFLESGAVVSVCGLAGTVTVFESPGDSQEVAGSTSDNEQDDEEEDDDEVEGEDNDNDDGEPEKEELSPAEQRKMVQRQNTAMNLASAFGLDIELCFHALLMRPDPNECGMWLFTGGPEVHALRDRIAAEKAKAKAAEEAKRLRQQRIAEAEERRKKEEEYRAYARHAEESAARAAAEKWASFWPPPTKSNALVWKFGVGYQQLQTFMQQRGNGFEPSPDAECKENGEELESKENEPSEPAPVLIEKQENQVNLVVDRLLWGCPGDMDWLLGGVLSAQAPDASSEGILSGNWSNNQLRQFAKPMLQPFEMRFMEVSKQTGLVLRGARGQILQMERQHPQGSQYAYAEIGQSRCLA